MERARKSPHDWVEKKRRKKSKKVIGMEPVPLEGSCERRKVPVPCEAPSLVGNQPEQKGNFRTLKESTVANLWQPEQREYCTVSQYHPSALPSLTCTSINSEGGWVLKFRLWRS